MLTPNELLIMAAKTNSIAHALNAIAFGADVTATDEDGNNAAIWFGFYNNLAGVLAMADKNPAVLLQSNRTKRSVVGELARHNNYAGVIACYDLNIDAIYNVAPNGVNVAIALARTNNIEGVLAVADLAPDLLTMADDDGETVLHKLLNNCSLVNVARVVHCHPEVLKLNLIADFIDSNIFNTESMAKYIAALINMGFEQPENFAEALQSIGVDEADISRLRMDGEF